MSNRSCRGFERSRTFRRPVLWTAVTFVWRETISLSAFQTAPIAEGARQLGAILESHGYPWDSVPVGAGLHLKSSINYVGKNTLLLTAPFQNLDFFASYAKIVLDETETYAANTLWVNDSLIMPKGFPATRKQLSTLKLPIVELDVSEVAKMDGGLTCLSLRY